MLQYQYWKLIVEPRWGSIVWVIGNPACVARRWALGFNAVDVIMITITMIYFVTLLVLRGPIS